MTAGSGAVPLAAAEILRGASVGVQVDGVTKTFWQYRQHLLRSRPSKAFPALGPVSLDIAPGEFVAVVGPSGSGKSTLLWIIGGLLKATSGEVRFDHVPPHGRRGNPATFVFQDFGLLPWRSARDNVALPLQRRGPGFLGRPSTEDWARVDAALDLVGLEDFHDALPSQLSGGMQQRVAIARALVGRPGLLLMDEPFGGLDAQTRTVMQIELLRLWSAWRGTVLFVTHDIDEALYLADRVVVIGSSPGRVLRTIDVPFDRPRDPARTREDPRFTGLRNDIWTLLHPDHGTGTAS